MNNQSQNKSTPAQVYNSKELINKSQNHNSQALNLTPQDKNDPMIHSLFPLSQNKDFPAKKVYLLTI